MANNCYNIFTFFGKKIVLNQVDEWFKALQTSVINHHSSDKGISCRSLFEVFMPHHINESDLIDDCTQWFGQKWVYPDFGETLSLKNHEIGFVSSWSAPNKLQDLLTQKLHELDKGIVLLNTIQSDEFSEAFRYTAIRKNGTVFSAESVLELEDESDIESGDYALFYEHHIDSIEDLLFECPASKKNISAHLKTLNILFDEAVDDSN